MGHVLILTNISREDIMRIQPARVAVAAQSKVYYTDLPKRFTGIADWPKVSNLRCWHCGITSTNRPYFIPVDVSVDKNKVAQCTPYGHFDSWACAARYANDKMDSSQFHDVLNSIRIFEAAFTGERIGEHTHLAKSPQLLREYSGNSGMTHEEWSRPI